MIKQVLFGHEAVVNQAPAVLPLAEGPRSVPLGVPIPRRSDEARLRAMVDDHSDFTWRSLRRLGLSPDAADDATQRVFVVAHERLADIVPGCEKAFLFNTAVRVACRVRRTHARRREVLGADETLETADPAPHADELLDRRRARLLLEDLLDQMPMDLRVVFVLFELEGMKMTEIAATIDLPEGTVASRLRRARAEFQAALKRYQARGRGGAR